MELVKIPQELLEDSPVLVLEDGLDTHVQSHQLITVSLLEQLMFVENLEDVLLHSTQPELQFQHHTPNVFVYMGTQEPPVPLHQLLALLTTLMHGKNVMSLKDNSMLNIA